MEVVSNKKISPEMHNPLGQTVAEMCDEYISKIRCLIMDNYPDVESIKIEIIPLEDGNGFRHRVSMQRVKNERVQD